MLSQHLKLLERIWISNSESDHKAAELLENFKSPLSALCPPHGIFIQDTWIEFNEFKNDLDCKIALEWSPDEEKYKGGTGKRWRIFDESWLRNRQWRFFHRFDTMILWSKYQRSCPETWISLERATKARLWQRANKKPTQSRLFTLELHRNYYPSWALHLHRVSGWPCQQQTVKDLIFVKLSLNDRAISVFRITNVHTH